MDTKENLIHSKLEEADVQLALLLEDAEASVFTLNLAILPKVRMLRILMKQVGDIANVIVKEKKDCIGYCVQEQGDGSYMVVHYTAPEVFCMKMDKTSAEELCVLLNK